MFSSKLFSKVTIVGIESFKTLIINMTFVKKLLQLYTLNNQL